MSVTEERLRIIEMTCRKFRNWGTAPVSGTYDRTWAMMSECLGMCEELIAEIRRSRLHLQQWGWTPRLSEQNEDLKTALAELDAENARLREAIRVSETTIKAMSKHFEKSMGRALSGVEERMLENERLRKRIAELEGGKP